MNILLIIGFGLVVIGAPWWYFNNPNAERPASLLVGVGVILIGVAGWMA